MNFTVIYPNISNRTIINELKSELNYEDELITFKSNSSTIVKELNEKISNSKYDNILIINPRDTSFSKYTDFLHKFRNNGFIINNFITKNGSKYIGSKTSCKFDKNEITTPINGNVKNVKEFIEYMFNNSKNCKQVSVKRKPKTSKYYSNSNIKEVTVAMINYMREDRLLKTLNNLYNSTFYEINLVLNCQGYENISNEMKTKIENVCNQFKDHHL